ncbi:MAG: Ger(x)C family spore germination protein [Clostridiales bacterium]|nr:Ger(x)C family spore germination protein [Clostridiales bacterium]
MRYPKSFLVFLIIFSLMFLSGCNLGAYFVERREIRDLEFMRVMGIDKSLEEPDSIEISLLYLPESGGGDGGGNEKNGGDKESGNVRNIRSKGLTVFEAIRDAEMYSEKHMHISHIHATLIGEGAAKEGLIPYIDFISRGFRMRLKQNIYIIKGSTAEDFMDGATKVHYILPNVLKHFEMICTMTSTSRMVQLIELLNMIDFEYAGVIIPAIKLIEGVSTEKEEKDEMMNVDLDGFAVLDRESRLVGYADKRLSAGINIINDKYVDGIIDVLDPYGFELTLDVVELKCKKKYKFVGDELDLVQIDINVSSNIGEQHSRKDIFDEKGLEHLKSQQAESIKEQILETIDFAQSRNVDILGFASDLHRKHPIKWDRIKEDWDDIFPHVKVNINVDSKIARTYDIKQPNALEDR